MAATFGAAGRMILPGLPFAVLFLGLWTGLVFVAAQPTDGAGVNAAFFALAGLTLFGHSLFSASLYRAVLPFRTGLVQAAWKLTLAWVLITVVMAVALSIWALFFGLIGASLGLVAGTEPVGEAADMTSLLQQSGTFWPLFLIFVASFGWLFWFVTRLMTFAAATSARGQVHVFRTWGWTKGQFRVIGPALLLLVAIPAGLGGAAALGLSGLAFGLAATPLQQALQSGLLLIGLMPAAWLGHGLAVSVYNSVADQGHMDES